MSTQAAANASEAAKVKKNLYLPADLVRRYEHAAIDRGEHVSTLVERAMRSYRPEAAPQR